MPYKCVIKLYHSLLTACHLYGAKPLLEAILAYCLWYRGSTFLIPGNEFKMLSAKWRLFSLDPNVLVDYIPELAGTNV